LNDAAELKGLIREHLLEILQASERAPARVAEPPAVDPGGGRQRLGQDHHHRQAGAALQERAAQRAAVRGRHVSRRRHRATGNLGPAHRLAGDPAKPGSDPSAVLFDAVQAARARKVDYVIVDTAGRLQTKKT
jgi:fused signal recognition particle receptor